ncbi:MAG: tetratricopeptide repeat protein [bacterium]|nr:tetratricopeptide repeat protein [bacterium]
MRKIRSVSCFLWILFFGIWTNAQTNTDSLIQQLPRTKGADKVYLLSDISYYLSGKNNPKSVLYAEKCLEAAQSLKDDKLIAEGYNALGLAHYLSANIKESLKANKKALKIRQKLGDDKGLLSSYSKIANCYNDLGEYENSISYNLKALRIAEKNKWSAYEGMIEMNIGVIYKEQKQYDKANQYYNKAIAAAKASNDTLSWVRALSNKGVVYRETEENEKALSNYGTALKLIEGKGQIDVESGILLNLGSLENNRGNGDKAMQYYEQALPLAIQANDQHTMAILYANIGNRLVQENQLDQARDYLQKSIDLCQTLGLKKQEAESLKGLSRLHIKEGDFETAYALDQQADSLKAEMLSVESTRAIEEINVKYETEKRKKQLAQQQIRINEQNSQFQRLVFLVFIVVLIALVTYLVLLIRKRKLRQRLEMEQEQAKSRMQAEKLRISRDLHDNIGAQLTFVINSLESVEKQSTEVKTKAKVVSLREQTKQTMNELREAIWTIQSDAVAVQELYGKIAAFVRNAKTEHFQVLTDHHLSEAQMDEKLSPEKAIAIFRVAQEAVNNAVKHSEGNCVTVEFHPKRMVISDNGKGFDTGAVQGGFGLTNMKARLKAAELEMDLQSNKNGTTIHVHF